MANRNFANSRIYTGHVMPVLLDCNFVVDSTNGNGLGLRSLKGPYVQAAYMASSVPIASNPIQVANSALKSAGSFAVLGASAVSNTGSSVLTGDLGIYPGTAITGFPPGTFTGSENIANTTAMRAQADAQALYTTLAALSTTVIPSALDGQTLTPGNYSFASGAATLATSATGTLTLNGAGRYVIKTASTLTTGAGGVPVIALTGGATANNVFWIVGSSATINSGSAGTFQGSIIAQTSITDTIGGTVNGNLIALTGAVTLSAATTINAAASSTSPGLIVIQLQDNYSRSYGGFNAIVSPLSGSSLTSVVAGNAYTIVSLGTATLAQWQAVGVPVGLTPSLGMSFIASSSASIGGSAAVQASVASGITNIETVGDPNQSLAPNGLLAQGFGAQLILQCYSNGVKAAPADGSVISVAMYLSNSSILVAGE